MKPKMIRFLQCNLNRSPAAHDLLSKTCLENKVGVLLISEPNKKSIEGAEWLKDERSDSAIKIIDPNIRIKETGKGKGFVWVAIESCVIISCYISPNVSFQVFQGFWYSIQTVIQSLNYRKFIVAGDVNSKSFQWGSSTEDERGTALAEWLAEVDFVILNTGSNPTFIRGNTSSVIDITACSRLLERKIINWWVSNQENLSDHQYIFFDLQREAPITNAAPVKQYRWKYDGNKSDTFKKLIEKKIQEKSIDPIACVKALQEACDDIFGRKGKGGERRGVYWWNKDIAEKRKECHVQRRKLVRTNRKRGVTEEERKKLRENYYKAKKELRIEINNSKKRKWDKLCEDLNSNVFGDAYKIVRKKFKILPSIKLTSEEKFEIARTLFPQDQPATWENITVAENEVPLFTLEEIGDAFYNVRPKKSPGPDGLISEVVRSFFEAAPKYCQKLFNSLLVTGTFPEVWKRADLVLIEKGKRDAEGKMTYRPICLLDTLGKVMEYLLRTRLSQEIKEKGDLSPEQYGFREGRSTVDAIRRVMEVGKEAKRKGKLCGISLLDVRNAFNSMPWRGIMDELKNRKISSYLIKILGSYFQDRELKVDGDNKMALTCGVPQGSLIGPLVWNVYYDTVLRLGLPPNTMAVAYADDLAIVTSGKSKEELETVMNAAIASVVKWMKDHKLCVAPEKTEVVLLASKRACKEISVVVENMIVTSSPSAKYLGVVLDTDLKMVKHTRTAVEKAEKVAVSLDRLMPNVKGLTNAKRRILSSVVYSTLLYGAPAWGPIIRWKKYVNLLERVQRKVMLKLCRSYRTSSTPALQVLSGTLPIEMMIEERMEMYDLRKSAMEDEMERREKIKDLKEELLVKWQLKWEGEHTRGQWTKRLIPSIHTWISRTHGELSYHLSQFFTGHGKFGSYLHKMRKVRTSKCNYCDSIDTPEHTFFFCPRFAQNHQSCNRHIGVILTPDNIVGKMLEGQEEWNKINRMITEILKIKEKDGRRPYNTTSS